MYKDLVVEGKIFRAFRNGKKCTRDSTPQGKKVRHRLEKSFVVDVIKLWTGR